MQEKYEKMIQMQEEALEKSRREVERMEGILRKNNKLWEAMNDEEESKPTEGKQTVQNHKPNPPATQGVKKQIVLYESAPQPGIYAVDPMIKLRTIVATNDKQKMVGTKYGPLTTPESKTSWASIDFQDPKITTRYVIIAWEEKNKNWKPIASAAHVNLNGKQVLMGARHSIPELKPGMAVPHHKVMMIRPNTTTSPTTDLIYVQSLKTEGSLDVNVYEYMFKSNLPPWQVYVGELKPDMETIVLRHTSPENGGREKALISTGKIVAINGGMVTYTNDTTIGTSGAPVVAWVDNTYKLIAIHTKGHNDNATNSGQLLRGAEPFLG